MRFAFTISRKGMVLVLVPVVFGLICIGIIKNLYQRAEAESRRQADSRQFVSDVAELGRSFLDAGTDLVLWRASKREMFVDRYDKIAREVPEIFKRLRTMSENNPERHRHVQKLEQLGNKIIYVTSTFRHPVDPGEFGLSNDFSSRLLVGTTYQEFMKEVNELTTEEQEFQKKHTDEKAREEMETFLNGCIGVNLIVCFGLAIFFSRNITRRLAVLTDNYSRLAKREPLNQLVSGSDEIRQLDVNFHVLAHALLKAEQRKQEFVQMISHDLRTPLSAIQGTLALALRGSYGNLNDRGKSRLLDAEQDAERLISMINELLDMEKLEAGKLELETDEICIGPVIERSVESVRQLAEQNNVAIQCQPAREILIGDSDRLMRVLINLISNAIKYSPGGTAITISVSRETGFIRITVTDQGRGIPASALPTIFDRFQQVEKSDQKLGSGLGLSICKAIVEAHGGTIGVESEVDKGSTFWFRLPWAGEEQSAKDAMPEPSLEH